VNKEHEDSVFFVSVQNQDPTLRRYTEGEAIGWSFVTLKLWGPFKEQSYHAPQNYTNGSTPNNLTAARCSEFVFLCEYSSSPNMSQCPDSDNPPGDENCQSVQLLDLHNFTDTSFDTISRTITPNDRQDNSMHTPHHATHVL